MSATFSQLVQTPTKEALYQLLLKGAKGIGIVTNTGFSPGKLAVSGTPVASYSLRVKIVTAGRLGVGEFQVATDGVTYGSTIGIPSSGSYALGSTGLTLVFTDEESGLESFALNDVFSCEIEASGLQVDSWQRGSTLDTHLRIDASLMEDVYALISAIASGGLLSESSGDWLDLLGRNVYALTRNAAVSTIGTIHLEDGGGGPWTISDGQLIFVADNGLRFVNVGGFTLSLAGTADITVRAESPGAQYNVANGSISNFVSPLPGVSVSNPALSSGTWITTQGADKESDAAYKSRCSARWPSLGTGATAETYDLWCRTADSSVTRTKVIASGVTPGQIDIYLAGTSGPVGSPAIAAVDVYIETRVPLTVTYTVDAATGVAVTVGGTVYVRSGSTTQAQIDVAQNLGALFGGGTNTISEELPGVSIGGTVYVSQIVEQIMLGTGVRNVALSAPASDVVLSETEVATITLALTYTAV